MLTVKDSNRGKRASRRRKLLWVEEGRGRRVSINILPDNVLLEIFDHYVILSHREYDLNAWHNLVHVCQRWRYVVFDSPRRLDLRLLCTDRTPVTNMLHIWPALPVVIFAESPFPASGVTNIISALRQHNRVCKIYIDAVSNSLLKEFAAMEEPFPALTTLTLWSYDENAVVFPDSFLGGSAPRLRSLWLKNIPFPGLPKLLLSNHHLVSLHLRNIPHSGYFSPEAMVTSLSTLTSLEGLFLQFRYPRSQVDRSSRLLPPLTRIILPALTKFTFKGDSEYLEDIVSRLKAPLLSHIDITLFNQLIFDTPQLCHFISRTSTFREPYQANISCHKDVVLFRLYRRSGPSSEARVDLRVSCKPLDWQISSLAQLCNTSFPPLPTLERLDIDINNGRDSLQEWQDDIEDLELLRPFTSVKDLHLSEHSFRFIAPALQELSEESVTEVLPALQTLFFTGPMSSGPAKEAIRKIIAARQLAGCPITVHHRDYRYEGYKNWEVDD